MRPLLVHFKTMLFSFLNHNHTCCFHFHQKFVWANILFKQHRCLMPLATRGIVKGNVLFLFVFSASQTADGFDTVPLKYIYWRFKITKKSYKQTNIQVKLCGWGAKNIFRIIKAVLTATLCAAYRSLSRDPSSALESLLHYSRVAFQFFHHTQLKNVCFALSSMGSLYRQDSS